ADDAVAHLDFGPFTRFFEFNQFQILHFFIYLSLFAKKKTLCVLSKGPFALYAYDKTALR
ncbi:MAG TPA: hypothetical protein PK986_11475, partial [Spirochaetota bacterium]|nr:hypothetical protein [Spirochaetota bacterium]